jgi:hypothetical protein
LSSRDEPSLSLYFFFFTFAWITKDFNLTFVLNSTSTHPNVCYHELGCLHSRRPCTFSVRELNFVRQSFHSFFFILYWHFTGLFFALYRVRTRPDKTF